MLNKNAGILCKMRACEIERAFAEELVLLEFDNLYNETYRGYTGKGMCESEGGGDNCAPNCADLIDSCCGKYPNRFPFNDGGLKECCADGTVKVAGTCGV